MRQIFRMAIVLLTATTLAACSQLTTQEVFADFEQLYCQTEAKCNEFSERDWAKYEQKRAKLENELSKFEYTNTEKITIGRLKVKHAGLTLQNKAQKAGQHIEAAANEVANAVKAINE